MVTMSQAVRWWLLEVQRDWPNVIFHMSIGRWNETIYFVHLRSTASQLPPTVRNIHHIHTTDRNCLLIHGNAAHGFVEEA